MSEIEIIDLKKWRKTWAPIYNRIYQRQPNGKNINFPNDFLTPEGISKPFFANSDWEMAAIPYQLRSWIFGTKEPNETDSIPGYDGHRNIFSAVRKLGLQDVVLSVAHFLDVPGRDVDPEKVGAICRPTHSSVNKAIRALSNFDQFYEPIWVFDPNGRWGLACGYAQYVIEDSPLTLIGGDAIFMEAFYKASGGEQAVIDQMTRVLHHGEWITLDVFDEAQNLFNNLGWKYPTPDPNVVVVVGKGVTLNGPVKLVLEREDRLIILIEENGREHWYSYDRWNWRTILCLDKKGNNLWKIDAFDAACITDSSLAQTYSQTLYFDSWDDDRILKSHDGKSSFTLNLQDGTLFGREDYVEPVDDYRSIE